MIDFIYSDEKLPTKMVVWDLGRRCNFDCTYCTGWMHSTTAPFNSFERYKKTAKFIDDYYSIYSMFHKKDWRIVISFTGGEPAVNPDFFKLLPYMKEQYPYMELNLTTNGTWNERKGKELLKYLDSITVSYHCEGTQKQKELIRNNLLWTQKNIKNKNRLKVNVMMHMDYWDECVDLIENFLKPNNINFIPRIIGDDGRFRTEWFKDVDGQMRRTSHLYTKDQQEYLKKHWSDKNKNVGGKEVKKTSSDGLARKMGRMCCGGRCMTVGSGDEKSDTMFIEQSNFKGWNCMVNWFFLHIEEDKDAVYHHQTCMAKTPDTPEVEIGPLLKHVTTFSENRGPICNLSTSEKYIEWLENKVSREGKPPTMICPNLHCGCGICVPKAKHNEDFNTIKRKYIIC